MWGCTRPASLGAGRIGKAQRAETSAISRSRPFGPRVSARQPFGLLGLAANPQVCPTRRDDLDLSADALRVLQVGNRDREGQVWSCDLD